MSTNVQTCSNGGKMFLIIILFLFFLLLYILFDIPSKKEEFVDRCNGGVSSGGRSSKDQLLDPAMMEVYQGVSIPLKYKPTEFDKNDPTVGTVDGTKDQNAKRSMYMFSYNRCAPECCIDSPYSCDRGCVCMTPRQEEFLGQRGFNNGVNGCTFENV